MGRFNDRQNYNNYERENFGRGENNFDNMYDSREYSNDYQNQDNQNNYMSDRASRPYPNQNYPSRQNMGYNDMRQDPARPYNDPSRDNYQRNYPPRDYNNNYRNAPQRSGVPNDYYEKYPQNYQKDDVNHAPPQNGDSKVIFCTPRSYEDIQKLIDSLKRKQSLIVDVDKIDPRDTQRYLDFLSGAIYALNGSYQKIDNKKFYFAPQGVSITIPYDLTQKKDEKW